MSRDRLLLGILTSELVTPFQQTRIGGHERCLIRDRRRDDEPVGRIAMQTFEVAREYRDMASEWNLINPRIEDLFSQLYRRINRSQSAFGNQHRNLPEADRTDGEAVRSESFVGNSLAPLPEP